MLYPKDRWVISPRFTEDGEQQGVVISCSSGDFSIYDVGRCVTPPGVPFRIVDLETVLSIGDLDTCKVDFSNPDGYGIGGEAFHKLGIKPATKD